MVTVVWIADDNDKARKEGGGRRRGMTRSGGCAGGRKEGGTGGGKVVLQVTLSGGTNKGRTSSHKKPALPPLVFTPLFRPSRDPSRPRHKPYCIQTSMHASRLEVQHVHTAPCTTRLLTRTDASRSGARQQRSCASHGRVRRRWSQRRSGAYDARRRNETHHHDSSGYLEAMH